MLQPTIHGSDVQNYAPFMMVRVRLVLGMFLVVVFGSNYNMSL